MAKRILPLALAAFVAVLVGSSPSGAQTYEPGTAVASDTTPAPGQDVTISGSGCVPGETVTVAVQGDSATTTADAEGDFRAIVTAPSTPGTYDVTATCGTRVLGVQITVGGTGATVAAPLPRTGSSSTSDLGRLGVALGAAGGVAVLVARRRRSATTVAG